MPIPISSPGWRASRQPRTCAEAGRQRDFATLTGLLKQPQAALGERGYPRPAWHCSMRAAPGDRMLSDDEWAAIAHEVMHHTGLSPYGQEDEAVRWIAVRHGDDHIHLVAMLARQDGGKPSLSWERYKVRAACLAAEQRYGLRSTAPADHTAARRPTRAENEKAARRGLEEAPRITLRRLVTTAAAAAGSEHEFFARLDQAGVLVRKRFSISNPGQVTGYAVALPGDTAKDGGPVWYGGGKLAPDLSWPKLRHRWTPYRVTPGTGRLTTEQRNAVCDHAARVAADAAAQIRTWPGPTRLPPPTLPGPPPTPSTWLPPYSAAASFARPPTPTTAPLAHPWPHPAAHADREPAPPGRPAAVRIRLLDRRSVDYPDHAHHPAGRARRSRRRTPPISAALRTGCRRTARSRTPLHRHPLSTAAPPGSAPSASTAAQLVALSFPPVTSGRHPPIAGQPRTDKGGPQPPRRASPPRQRGPSR